MPRQPPCEVFSTSCCAPGFFSRPFYDLATFSLPAVFTGTSIAALTYIGFNSISTLSKEVVDPARNILKATVLTCLATGLLAAIEVYAGQLVWSDFRHFPDVDTAYSFVAGRAGGAICRLCGLPLHLVQPALASSSGRIFVVIDGRRFCAFSAPVRIVI